MMLKNVFLKVIVGLNFIYGKLQFFNIAFHTAVQKYRRHMI